MLENMRRPKARALLTRDQAVAVFLQKYSNEQHSSTTEKSHAVAEDFGISSKTVRDIWCGRSWLEATYDLWQQVHSHVNIPSHDHGWLRHWIDSTLIIIADSSTRVQHECISIRIQSLEELCSVIFRCWYSTDLIRTSHVLILSKFSRFKSKGEPRR